jgi:hypothetical protein
MTPSTIVYVLIALFAAYVWRCWHKDTLPAKPGSHAEWEAHHRKQREEFLARFNTAHPDNNNTGHAGEE